MIPWMLRLRIRGEKGGIRLWIPLFLLWLLLLPAALLAGVAWLILRAAGSVHSGADQAARIIAAAGAVLWRLGGLRVDVRSADSSVTFRFR